MIVPSTVKLMHTPVRKQHYACQVLVLVLALNNGQQLQQK